MQSHNADAQTICGALNTSADSGLSQKEAQLRLDQHGPNKLAEKKRKPLLARFFDQFKDVMILILLAAAAVSFIVAVNGHDPSEFFEPLLIVLIVVLNAVMGMVQESKAEAALEALENMSAPHARVLREGKELSIDAWRLVPGDIILLEAGDYVPADARLIQSASLQCEESALTGESVPVQKNANEVVPEDAPLGDRINQVYSGCSVTYGRGKAVVTQTGMNTQMGRIANLIRGEKDARTPLQMKLASMGKALGFVALGACAVIFIIGLIDGMPVLDIFMTSVSLAVSAIPEGLPAIVTIVLSLGVTRMAKRNAIIRRLPAVETLGSATVICSDKTGTLTQNRMTVTRLTPFNVAENELLRLSTLCCDGTVSIENGRETHLGDPTETAIVMAALKAGITKEELNRLYPRAAEVPFDSERKRMSVAVKDGDGYTVVVKGGVDTVLPCCVDAPENAQLEAEGMSRDALRVLAVAVKRVSQVSEEPAPEELESGLTFIGLIGMIDPPRQEAKDAVALCRGAGIKPVMITGDHVSTASAIARELGILVDGDEAITGVELAAMSEEDLIKHVESTAVYARVSPEDKIRIVKAWQARGAIVSMTGDGVNDAPALKAADIGCAMGITGTDVAKGASDMILTDDNFATIVEAVKEGRGIYANIKKAVGFLLGTNIGEVVAVFAAILLWKVTPLLSMQLLWINLITDSLPAIALGLEKVDEDMMSVPPRPKDEGVFANGLGIKILLLGAFFGALTLIAFRIGIDATGALAGGQTMAFMVLGLSQVAHSLNMRSDSSLFRTGFFTNRYLTGAVALSFLLTALLLFVAPLRTAFGLIALPAELYWIGLLMCLTPIAVMEIAKLIINAKKRKKGA